MILDENEELNKVEKNNLMLDLKKHMMLSATVFSTGEEIDDNLDVNSNNLMEFTNEQTTLTDNKEKDAKYVDLEDVVNVDKDSIIPHQKSKISSQNNNSFVNRKYNNNKNNIDINKIKSLTTSFSGFQGPNLFSSPLSPKFEVDSNNKDKFNVKSFLLGSFSHFARSILSSSLNQIFLSNTTISPLTDSSSFKSTTISSLRSSDSFSTNQKLLKTSVSQNNDFSSPLSIRKKKVMENGLNSLFSSSPPESLDVFSPPFGNLHNSRSLIC